MRIGLIGGGVIARLFLEQARRGGIGEAEVVAVMGRSNRSRGKTLAQEFGIAFVTERDELIASRPEVVIEAASHAAVREHVEALLSSGIAVIVLSAGALVDDRLRERLERAAARHRALLYVPSGGIGGLDALKAACAAGADEVIITVTKPPAAWKDIAYVERLGIDLDRLDAAVTLFDGTARDGVPGWRNSLLIPSLKYGRLYRLKLSADGSTTTGRPIETWKSFNRYRDIAKTPDERTFYVSTDLGGLARSRSGTPTNEVDDPGVILRFRYRGR